MVTKDMVSTDPQVLWVELGSASYPIRVEHDWLSGIAAEVQRVAGDLSHAMVIHDEAVTATVARTVAASLAGAGLRVETVAIPSGESSKSVEQLSRLWEWMLQRGADRQSLVVAVGGGVTGDLAGFAAATYQRGIRLVQVPTTLLSQVDSSVGGKTGINLPAAKNMVGAFWQPILVAIDTATLQTLPRREYLSGLAEVIKYGVIEQPDFFEWLEDAAERLVDRQPQAVREAILRSCAIKAAVVGADERETSGRRAILNYGHTFAHAIEATAGYGLWLHGEAVAIGMRMAAELAAQRGRIPGELVERQSRLIERCGLPLVWPEADADRMLAAMRSDKKNSHGQIRLILPTRLGHVELVRDATDEEIRRAIERGCGK